MSGRIQKFGSLSLHEKLLFCESFSLHLWIGLLLKIIPFRWIPRLFAGQQFETPTEEDQSHTRSVGTAVSSRQSAEQIELIRTAIRRAGMASPWKNRCLVSSLAGRCMLRRRRILSQVSLGVAKSVSGKTVAHAWLSSGEFEIVAKNGDFHELYIF